MKFGKLTKYNMENIFCKYHAESEAGKLVPDLFLIFTKALLKVKTSGQHFSLNIF